MHFLSKSPFEKKIMDLASCMTWIYQSYFIACMYLYMRIYLEGGQIQISLNYIIKWPKICLGPPLAISNNCRTPLEKFSGTVHVVWLGRERKCYKSVTKVLFLCHWVNRFVTLSQYNYLVSTIAQWLERQHSMTEALGSDLSCDSIFHIWYI